MLETIIVGLVVAVAFAVSGRYLFREASGGKKACGAGCADDCPLSSACSCGPEEAPSKHAPDGCRLTTGHAK